IERGRSSSRSLNSWAEAACAASASNAARIVLCVRRRLAFTDPLRGKAVASRDAAQALVALPASFERRTAGNQGLQDVPAQLLDPVERSDNTGGSLRNGWGRGVRRLAGGVIALVSPVEIGDRLFDAPALLREVRRRQVGGRANAEPHPQRFDAPRRRRFGSAARRGFGRLGKRPALPPVEQEGSLQARGRQALLGIGRSQDVQELLFESLTPTQRAEDRGRVPGQKRRDAVGLRRKAGWPLHQTRGVSVDLPIERVRHTRRQSDLESAPAREPNDGQARIEVGVKSVNRIVVDALGPERLLRLATRSGGEQEEKREARPDARPSHRRERYSSASPRESERGSAG